MGEIGLSAVPERAGLLTVKGTAELIFENFDQYDKWGADSTAKMEIIATGASGESLTYTMEKTRIIQATPHMSGRDRLIGPIEFESIYNDENTENLVTTLVNGDTVP